MDDRRDERIQVTHNVLLLDQRAVARGCRMQDVSSLGMLLRCKRLGRPPAIDERIHIHLSLGSGEDRQRMAVEARVRRVDADLIGVEFLRPEQELVALVEAHLNREHERSRETAMTHTFESNARGAATGQASPMLLGLLSLALVLVAVLTLYTYFQVSDLDGRMQSLQATAQDNTVALRHIRDRLTTPQTQADLAALRTDMDRLKGSISEFRQRFLVDTRPAANAPETPPADSVEPPPPPPSAEAIAAGPAPEPPADGGETTTERPAPTGVVMAPTTTPAAAEDPQTGDDAGEEPAARTGEGRWVINIVSTSDRDAAERFAERARAQGIPVEVNRAGERDLYRLQLTGFASRETARRYGESVKDTLGLKELWIFER